MFDYLIRIPNKPFVGCEVIVSQAHARLKRMPSGEGGWSPMEGTHFCCQLWEVKTFRRTCLPRSSMLYWCSFYWHLGECIEWDGIFGGWRMTCVLSAFEGSAEQRSIRWLGLASYSKYLEILCVNVIEFLYFLSRSWGLRLQWLRRRALGSIPVCSWQQIGRLLFVQFLNTCATDLFFFRVVSSCTFLKQLLEASLSQKFRVHDGAGVLGLANMLGDDHCFLCFAATWQNTRWITRGRTKNATHRPLRIALQLLMLILFFMLLWHTFLLRIFELLKLGGWLVWWETDRWHQEQCMGMLRRWLWVRVWRFPSKDITRLDFCILRCLPKAIRINMTSTSRDNVDLPEIWPPVRKHQKGRRTNEVT